jgi:hypothetical protein
MGVGRGLLCVIWFVVVITFLDTGSMSTDETGRCIWWIRPLFKPFIGSGPELLGRWSSTGSRCSTRSVFSYRIQRKLHLNRPLQAFCGQVGLSNNVGDCCRYKGKDSQNTLSVKNLNSASVFTCDVGFVSSQGCKTFQDNMLG